MKKALLIPALALAATASFAEEKLEWKGEALGTIRYHAEHDFDEATTQGQLKRAYIGYKAKYGKSYEAGVIYDSKFASTDKKATPFLKNAFIKYKNKNFDVTTGIQSAISYKGALSVWDLLYLRYPLSNTAAGIGSFDGADLGILGHSNVSGIDIYAGVFQGNGYKNLSEDLENERYEFLINKKAKTGISASLYGDLRPFLRDSNSDTEFDGRLLAHVGYSTPMLKTGLEAAIRNAGTGEKYEGKNIKAFAANMRLFASKKLEQFTRAELKFDQYEDSNEYFGMTGVQYSPIPKFKIGAHYSAAIDSDEEYTHSVGVGTEIKF